MPTGRVPCFLVWIFYGGDTCIVVLLQEVQTHQLNSVGEWLLGDEGCSRSYVKVECFSDFALFLQVRVKGEGAIATLSFFCHSITGSQGVFPW